MTHEHDESPPSPRASNRFLLMAGVAGAVALGVGAGLWARPADVERDPALAVAKALEAPKRTGRLQIVLDDSPAPIGKPIEVLPGVANQHLQPAAAAPVFITPEPQPQPTEMAPRRSPTGLVKVQAVSAPVEVAPPPAPRIDPRKAEADARRAAAAEQARIDARREAVKLEKAQAEKARLQKVRLEKARVDKAKAETLRIAKAEKAAETRRLADRAAKAKAEKIQLAKAKREAEAAVQLAETKRANALRRLAHAVARVVPHRKTEAPRIELADARSLKAKKATVSKKRCVSPDPGAAIVCADPALASADKRLNQAYRDAEAAGVDAATLERQQRRWLGARTAAAREAPWAVHDVYLARIAELNDQAREARAPGY